MIKRLLCLSLLFFISPCHAQVKICGYSPTWMMENFPDGSPKEIHRSYLSVPNLQFEIISDFDLSKTLPFEEELSFEDILATNTNLNNFQNALLYRSPVLHRFLPNLSSTLSSVQIANQALSDKAIPNKDCLIAKVIKLIKSEGEIHAAIDEGIWLRLSDSQKKALFTQEILKMGVNANKKFQERDDIVSKLIANLQGLMTYRALMDHLFPQGSRVDVENNDFNAWLSAGPKPYFNDWGPGLSPLGQWLVKKIRPVIHIYYFVERRYQSPLWKWRASYFNNPISGFNKADFMNPVKSLDLLKKAYSKTKRSDIKNALHSGQVALKETLTYNASLRADFEPKIRNHVRSELKKIEPIFLPMGADKVPLFLKEAEDLMVNYWVKNLFPEDPKNPLSWISSQVFYDQRNELFSEDPINAEYGFYRCQTTNHTMYDSPLFESFYYLLLQHTDLLVKKE